MNTTKRAQPWLGTLVEIGIADPNNALQTGVFDAAFAAIARVHEAMSLQRAESDLARFNAASTGSLTVCEDGTLAVLNAARALSRISNEVFDISLGSGGSAAWSLEPDGLRKLTPGVALDVGGIAKGYAVDQAVAVLRTAGVAAGWVNAGGDLRVFGALELPIHIRSLDDAARTLPLAGLREGALATSVLPLPDGRRAHVTVAAPECLWADALTKVVAYAGEEHSRALLARYHARAWRHAPF